MVTTKKTRFARAAGAMRFRLVGSPRVNEYSIRAALSVGGLSETVAQTIVAAEYGPLIWDPGVKLIHSTSEGTLHHVWAFS